MCRMWYGRTCLVYENSIFYVQVDICNACLHELGPCSDEFRFCGQVPVYKYHKIITANRLYFFALAYQNIIVDNKYAHLYRSRRANTVICEVISANPEEMICKLIHYAVHTGVRATVCYYTVLTLLQDLLHCWS